MKKEKLKFKKQINNIHSFIQKTGRSKIYDEKTYNGVVPHHISKKLRQKKKKSKTPRNKSKKGKLSFIGSNNKNRNLRSGTAGGFYPVPSNNSTFNISPSVSQKRLQVNDQIKSYRTIETDNSKKRGKSDDKGNSKLKDSEIKYKMNPSPYKRGERGMDELLHSLHQQIEELQKIKSVKMKNYINAGKSKSKGRKKTKKKKARSHSPQEKAKKLQKMMGINNNIKKNILKSIQRGDVGGTRLGSK